jgi:hypothetical protein
LSDDSEPQLSLQNIAWITRKTLAKAPISLSISHYIDDSGLHHFDYEQKTLGRTVTQANVLDGKAVETNHPLFGDIAVTHSLTPVSSIDDSYLTEALEAGTTEVIDLGMVNATDGWKSRQILGIEIIDGERRHTRRTVVKKGDEVVKTRLVYDWATT